MGERDMPEVVALLERTLGPAPGGVARADLFAWKHLRNPFGPSIALVAEMGGEIVGLRSFLQWELAGGPSSVLAVRAVDTATAPEVRRLGIFSRLTTEALEVCRDEGAAFVFNTPNEKSLPGYLKMGWQVVGDWPLRLKVRRPDRVVSAVLGRALRAGGAVEPPRGSVLVPAGDATSGAAFDRASGWAGPDRVLHTPRTAAYLRWRYADGPLPYHVLHDRDALVVVRLRARGRLREAVLCEAAAAPGASRALARMLAELPKETGADHVVAHIGPGWTAAGLLAPAGYHRLPTKGMRFTVRPIVDGPTPDPRESAAWSLTLGDLEVF
jgi:GNAT superfamily N-acetyltransferase